MDTVHTGSIGAVHGEHTKEAQAFSTTTTTTNDHHKQPLDAGALFVLKSKGTSFLLLNSYKFKFKLIVIIILIISLYIVFVFF
ncbi:hypothetical protein Hanom_Chr13g01231851 [Helianthus anomalus]